MTTPLRIAAFVAGLAVVFGAAFGVGRLVEDDQAQAQARGAGHDHAEEYHLRVLDPPAGSGRAVLRFVVEGHDGAPVTRYDVRHEKRLHLIAVDTGYTGFQHLHPTMAADGTWSTPIVVAGGRTQLYADFQPTGGEAAVARASFDAAGLLGSPVFSTLRSQQVDGYTVTVLGDLSAGGTSDLRFEISRDGVPVRDLEPYLGAYGHLVMLRKADGEYLHVHPEDGPAGPEVAFAASVPSAARYHLYLDFQHGGRVRTAAFVLDAGGAGEPSHEEEGGHGDH